MSLEVEVVNFERSELREVSYVAERLSGCLDKSSWTKRNCVEVSEVGYF